MPESTCTAALAWFVVIAGAQCVASLVSAWQTTRLLAEIAAVTRATRADIA